MGKFAREAIAALFLAPAVFAAPTSTTTAEETTVPASGKVQLTAAAEDAMECTVLPAPTNPKVVFWKSDTLSTRRVDAYEFAATWDAVPEAASYTVCYTQNTQSRTGGYTHVYETCFTQAGTKLNNGAVFYANNGLVNVTVQATSVDPCQRSQRATAVQVDTLQNVAVVCTDEKVAAEQESLADLFAYGEEADPMQFVVSQVTRTVEKGGASKNKVKLDWKLNPEWVTANANQKYTLQVCAGATRDWTEQDDAARTSYMCIDKEPGANGEGSADVELLVEDPRVVYLAGSVRAAGFCTQDSFDSKNKVTIANYYKMKAVSPVVSGSTGVTADEITADDSGLYMVSTSRTTPDQDIDVNYFTSVLAGLSNTWQLPMRTTPEGVLVHDTFVTPIDGVVMMGASHAGDDSSIALDIYVGETKETAKGGMLTSFSAEQPPNPTMLFRLSSNGKNTRIESKAMANTCLAGNPSPDEYEPPFIFEPCSDSAGQLFAVEEFAPGWMAVGSEWVTTEYDGYSMSWQQSASADAASAAAAVAPMDVPEAPVDATVAPLDGTAAAVRRR